MKIGVVEGYLTDNGFVTRMKEWDSAADLEDSKIEVTGTDEERESYTEGDDHTVYRATDGKLFFNRKVAETHQKTLETPELDEVLELLEKAKFLCEAKKEKVPALATILDVLTQVDGDGGEYLMEKYHDSTCW